MHNLARLTISALRHLLLDPRNFQGVVFRKSFDRGDLICLHVPDGNLAGAAGLSVHMHRAGPTNALAADVFCAGKLEMVPQCPESFFVGTHIHFVLLPIDLKGNHGGPSLPP